MLGIIAREVEQRVLEMLYASDSAELVSVTGRRRVGFDVDRYEIAQLYMMLVPGL